MNFDLGSQLTEQFAVLEKTQGDIVMVFVMGVGACTGMFV